MESRRFTAVLVMLLGGLVPAAAAELLPIEQLGKELFFDQLSSPDRQSCASCHAPQVGFTGPNPGINGHGGVYRGAVPTRFGGRKPPSSAYATLSPIFQYDDVEELFLGGNFWDGRATGWTLGSPAAEQALGPFLNPVEQNNPSKLAVLEQVAGESYADLWEIVWGAPLVFGTDDEVDTNYVRIGLAIAAYEGSPEVNAFSSKFDYFLAGEAELTPEEAWGMELFNGEANCAACHPAPLFTDFTYDNVGIPRNPANPFYRMNRVYLDDGTPINPLGFDWVDPGLGGFLESLPEDFFTDLGLVKDAAVAENLGKHRVPTLRNVGLRPGLGFPKAYMHNAALKSLKEVVHFYNTRDVEEWAPPEVLENLNDEELGDLGLTDAEEDALVAFMNTLSDGYVPGAVERPLAGLVSSGDLRVVGRHPAPAIQLAYDVPRDGAVRLDVFDASGRHVATLSDGWQSQGQHRAWWSTPSSSAGVYVVRLAQAGSTTTRKVVVTR